MLPLHLPFWKSITTDQYTLNIVKGYDIDISSSTYKPRSKLAQSVFNAETTLLINQEIKDLLEMEVIETCSPVIDQYLSPIFLVRKPDGSNRKILNLKLFNEYVTYEHFKVENLKNLCDILTPECYMTSIDLKKAYYSVAIGKNSRKFLRFLWQDTLYQYRALPNGLASAPRVFTKLMKALFALLREKGSDCVFYLDDSIFVAKTYEKAFEDTQRAVKLLNDAGFTIHEKKSMLKPCQRIKFLGFIIDTVKMKIYLPAEKQQRLLAVAKKLLHSSAAVIEDIAQVIGIIVSYLPAFIFGRLHYRGLENDKIAGLKAGSYKSIVVLSENAKLDLVWWINNVNNSGHPIKPLVYDVELFTDASQIGYGAVLNNVSINSKWSSLDIAKFNGNINCLELLAVKYALMSFSMQLKGSNVCVRVDNSTAVTYINKMGGTHSLECNIIAQEIWDVCINNSVMLRASHIPGKYNIEADYASRNFNDDIEISLKSNDFKNICKEFCLDPKIDLFASHNNYKVDVYASWKPDPMSAYVDAFTLNWEMFNCVYIFPPISLWGRVLSKLRHFKGSAVLIFPRWPGQYWYPSVSRVIHQQVTLPLDSVTASSRLRNTTFMAGKVLSRRS